MSPHTDALTLAHGVLEHLTQLVMLDAHGAPAGLCGNRPARQQREWPPRRSSRSPASLRVSHHGKSDSGRQCALAGSGGGMGSSKSTGVTSGVRLTANNAAVVDASVRF